MVFFVKLRAWQLFILFVVPSVAAQFLVETLHKFAIFLPLSVAISMIVFVAWLWSVGVLSNRRLSERFRKSTKLFSLGLLFVSLYMIGVFSLVNFLQIPLEILLPFHLASMFFMFYALWFTAKQFMTLQRRETLAFVDYSGTLFLFWFFFIGVWFIQPRINKLLG